MSSLELDEQRPVSTPRLAATVVLLRDADSGFEVAVMQRSLESGFLGGAIVFPGGRVDDDDASPALADETLGDWWDAEGVAARFAVCREALEEVGLALVAASIFPPQIAALRVASAARPRRLRDALAEAGLSFDLRALVPLSRWVTPEAERRRYDTRFFVAVAPAEQALEVDAREATRAFWARPSTLLAEFEGGKMPLFPPTHRTLEQLAPLSDVRAVLAHARAQAHEPVCPRFVVDAGVPTLALPGDPLHSIAESRIEGRSRYVLRDGVWRSLDP